MRGDANFGIVSHDQILLIIIFDYVINVWFIYFENVSEVVWN